MEDSIWNLASICPVVSEEKMFKECGRQAHDGGLPINKFTSEPSAQVLKQHNYSRQTGANRLMALAVFVKNTMPKHMRAPNNSIEMIPNLQRAITPEKIDRICFKFNQIIYSSSPIS